MRRRRTALLTLLLLVGLVAVPVVLTWRQVQQEQLNHDLIAAVDRNDVVVARRLLRNGADPNAPVLPKDKRPLWKRYWETMLHKDTRRHTSQSSPLFQAAVWLSRDQPKRALAAIKQKETPLVIDNVDMVRALVEAGANVNFHGGRKKATPLIVAAYFGKFETMKVLLAHNADVNVVDPNGDFALVSTAAGANVDLVEALLQHGANVNQTGKRGQTAILAALSPYHTERVKAVRETVACLLRHGASVNGKDTDGNTILSLARNYRDPQLTRMLKQAGAK